MNYKLLLRKGKKLHLKIVQLEDEVPLDYETTQNRKTRIQRTSY